MSKVLAIDTSTYVMGIAISDDGQVVGEIMTNIKKNHSIRLMPAIDQLMTEVNIRPQDLDKIVVAQGPGSYTGVRIGVTTAKTLAWSLKIPLIGVSSLAAMAQNGRYFQGIISPMIDARRGQVFTGHYMSHQGHVICQKNDQLVMISNWLDYLQEKKLPVLFIGQDVSLHRQLIEETLGELAIFPPQSAFLLRPSELIHLSDLEEVSEDLHHFVPNYHRLAEAEAKWQKEQKG